MDMIDNPGDNPLYGIELGLDPCGQFVRQLADTGIASLHLFRGNQIINGLRINVHQRKEGHSLNGRQIRKAAGIAGEADIYGAGRRS